MIELDYEYEMTDADRDDRKKQFNTFLKFGIPCVVSIILSTYFSWLILIGAPLVVFAVFYLVKFLSRTTKYYEIKYKKQIEKARVFYKNNPEQFRPFEELINKIQEKSSKFGFDVFENLSDDMDDPDVFRCDIFYDYRYYNERGELYGIFFAWYRGCNIIMNIDLFSLARIKLSTYLADSEHSFEPITKILSEYGTHIKKMRYEYDKRRDGAYVVMVPSGNMKIESMGGNRARVFIRSELGLEYIDLYMPDAKTYENFASLL